MYIYTRGQGAPLPAGGPPPLAYSCGAIYQNTFSNQLPSECQVSAARAAILAIYFYFNCKSCPKAKVKNTAQIVRLSLRNSCIVTISPDKLSLLLLSVGGRHTEVYLGQPCQGWEVFLLGSPPVQAFLSSARRGVFFIVSQDAPEVMYETDLLLFS